MTRAFGVSRRGSREGNGARVNIRGEPGVHAGRSSARLGDWDAFGGCVAGQVSDRDSQQSPSPPRVRKSSTVSPVLAALC